QVQLREQRPRLAKLLTGRKLARLPPADPARVVAGQDLVRLSVVLGHLDELERAGELPLVPEQLVHDLTREREERRQQDLEAVDTPQRNEEDRRRALPVLLDHR